MPSRKCYLRTIIFIHIKSEQDAISQLHFDNANIVFDHNVQIEIIIYNSLEMSNN